MISLTASEKALFDGVKRVCGINCRRQFLQRSWAFMPLNIEVHDATTF